MQKNKKEKATESEVAYSTKSQYCKMHTIENLIFKGISLELQIQNHIFLS